MLASPCRYLALCLVLSEWTYRTPFVQYFIDKAQKASPVEVIQLNDMQTDDSTTDEIEFSDTKNIISENSNAGISTERIKNKRRRLIRTIRLSMASVFTSFFVTLSMFPGVATMATSSKLDTWSPVRAARVPLVLYDTLLRILSAHEFI